jgi:type II secretory pathway component PulF
MPTFAYTAIDTQGKQTTGRLDADDRGAAMVSIESLGLMPVDVSASAAGKAPKAGAGAGAGRFAFLQGTKRVKQKHVLAFIRQLGNLLAAGVPLARGLQILIRETSHEGAKEQWEAVKSMVVDGTPLADAIAQFPKSFPPVYVAMVRAGEAGGFLDVVLKQIADFMSRERELKSKISTALIYPAVLATIASGVVIFLLTWFIPRFSTIFDEFGQTLPLLTRIIQAASFALLNYGPFVLVAIVLLIVAARQALTSEKGRRKRDEIVLLMPGIGLAAARFSLVRFCRMLGTLQGAGVPLISSLKVARAAIGNQTLTDAVDRAIENVQQGAPLARSLGECPQLFPSSVVEMVSVAEESGKISEELIRMAGEFEEELDRQLRVLVSLAEPAMLFVMASVVGLIVVGMLLPVFDLWDAIQ